MNRFPVIDSKGREIADLVGAAVLLHTEIILPDAENIFLNFTLNLQFYAAQASTS